MIDNEQSLAQCRRAQLPLRRLSGRNAPRLRRAHAGTHQLMGNSRLSSEKTPDLVVKTDVSGCHAPHDARRARAQSSSAALAVSSTRPMVMNPWIMSG